MSQTASPNRVREKGKPKGSRFWIALSFLLSASVLLWSFSLPFRQAGNPLVSSSPSRPGGAEQQLDLSERIKQRRTSAEEFRDAAIAFDQEFMRSVAKRNEPKRDLPGIHESRVSWNRHVESVKWQLHQLKDAKQGTLEWDEKQELLKSLEDGPRQ